jgi:regulator of nucleoside diphosphate kinase
MRDPSQNHDQIIVTDTDLERLRSVVDGSAAAESLAAELDRAIVVRSDEVPADVVTMNSQVTYQDCATEACRTVRVVYPQDADSARGHVSVLAPIGSALLGLHRGQEIEWRLPRGDRRIRVIDVTYQPEAAAIPDAG